jgi:hypothetical protein
VTEAANQISGATTKQAALSVLNRVRSVLGGLAAQSSGAQRLKSYQPRLQHGNQRHQQQGVAACDGFFQATFLSGRRISMRALLILGGAIVCLAWPGNPSLAQNAQTPIQVAQAGLCVTCQPFGETCCALRPSISACVQCGLSAGYRKEVQEAWCRVHQPRCSRKR